MREGVDDLDDRGALEPRETLLAELDDLVAPQGAAGDGDDNLVLRAANHTLYFTVTSGIDDETIIQSVNVPKNSERIGRLRSSSGLLTAT